MLNWYPKVYISTLVDTGVFFLWWLVKLNIIFFFLLLCSFEFLLSELSICAFFAFSMDIFVFFQSLVCYIIQIFPFVDWYLWPCPMVIILCGLTFQFFTLVLVSWNQKFPSQLSIYTFHPKISGIYVDIFQFLLSYFLFSSLIKLQFIFIYHVWPFFLKTCPIVLTPCFEKLFYLHWYEILSLSSSRCFCLQWSVLFHCGLLIVVVPELLLVIVNCVLFKQLFLARVFSHSSPKFCVFFLFVPP